MSGECPYCFSFSLSYTKHGHFIRASDKRKILRFKCQKCSHVFSKARFQKCYRQKKRFINKMVGELLCSGVSQRRISKILKINRKTVARKLLFLAFQARKFNAKRFNGLQGLKSVQFDDLETIEHTKCKPLSVTMAVEKHSRVILAFKVSQMPAKGHLAKKAYKKYGYREDQRPQERSLLFQKLSSKVLLGGIIESDDSPHYRGDLKNLIPQAIHKTYLGQRGAVTGQGELKKIAFDPLFSINHTFAMLRANINRLFRKTWCTTKLRQRLSDHIDIYAYYHNEVLLKKSSSKKAHSPIR